MTTRRGISIALTLGAAVALHELLRTRLASACAFGVGGSCPTAYATTGVDVLSPSGAHALVAVVVVLGLATALRRTYVLALATAMVSTAVAMVPFLALRTTRRLHQWPTPRTGLSVLWPLTGNGIRIQGWETHHAIVVSRSAALVALTGFAMFVVGVAVMTAWREQNVPAARRRQNAVRY